jgi:short-subunit dehydrogenase
VSIELAKLKIDLALFGRNESALSDVVNECEAQGGIAIPIVCDIAKNDRIQPAVSHAIQSLGGLNYLINCADISTSAKHIRRILISAKRSSILI